MLSYCAKYRKNKKSKKQSKVVRTKKGRIKLLSKCAVCDSKTSKFIKDQEAREFLSKLIGIKVPISSDLWIAPVESRSVRRASHQPIFMGDCLTICHMYLPCLPW